MCRVSCLSSYDTLVSEASAAHDQREFISAPGLLEPPPGVRHDGATVQLDKEFIDLGSHAGALAGSDDDGGDHKSARGCGFSAGFSGGALRMSRCACRVAQKPRHYCLESGHRSEER